MSHGMVETPHGGDFCFPSAALPGICRKELAASLWARAKQAGAQTAIERRNFGIADDIYAAGLLLAYMAFMPFCEPGSMDGPSLQR